MAEHPVQVYRRLNAEHQSLSSQIADMETQQREHELVIKTLKDLEGDRKCWRLVSSVLVEKKVSDVLPMVQETHEGIVQYLEKSRNLLDAKTKELAQYQQQFGFSQISAEGGEKNPDGSGSGKSSQGVLI